MRTARCSGHRGVGVYPSRGVSQYALGRGCVYPSMHWAGRMCIASQHAMGRECLLRGVVCPGECLPKGCLTGSVRLGGVCQGVSAWEVFGQGVSAQGGLPRGCLPRGCLPRTVSALGGVCLWGGLPGGGLPDTPPTVNGMMEWLTDRCKKHYLAATTLRTVINWLNIFSSKMLDSLIPNTWFSYCDQWWVI